MNTDRLIEHLLLTEPIDVAGQFSTRFADGSTGESGSCWFGSVDEWAVSVEGGPSIFAAGDHSVVTLPGKDRTVGPRHSLPNRPPWSLAIPRLALIFGRPTDDWRPLRISTREPTELLLVNTENPELQGRALVAPSAGIILEIATPSWTARFTADAGAGMSLRRQWHTEFDR